MGSYLWASICGSLQIRRFFITAKENAVSGVMPDTAKFFL
jgi:hypothetical protein